MGFLYCTEMSEAFIKHLQKQGNISVKAAGNRYWRRHPRGYENSDETHKWAALDALTMAAIALAEEDLIEPTTRHIHPVDYLQMMTDITDEQLKMFVEYASVEEFNRLIIEANQWDTEAASTFRWR